MLTGRYDDFYARALAGKKSLDLEDTLDIVLGSEQGFNCLSDVLQSGRGGNVRSTIDRSQYRVLMHALALAQSGKRISTPNDFMGLASSEVRPPVLRPSK